MKYATANGTAQAGSNYVAKSGGLTFPPGQRIQTVSVVMRGGRVKRQQFSLWPHHPVSGWAGTGSKLASMKSISASQVSKHR